MFGLEWYWSALIVGTIVHVVVCILGFVSNYLDGDEYFARLFARCFLGTPIWPVVWVWCFCTLIAEIWEYAWEKDESQ